MKKYYNKPSADVMELLSADVITASGLGAANDDVMDIGGNVISTGLEL
ncbi:MAG: hypothetical protein IJY08_06455 [Clostridia bacterium]|nr:hypothetical protein [Clostridia bacterium]